MPGRGQCPRGLPAHGGGSNTGPTHRASEGSPPDPRWPGASGRYARMRGSSSPGSARTIDAGAGRWGGDALDPAGLSVVDSTRAASDSEFYRIPADGAGPRDRSPGDTDDRPLGADV